ncbi:Serine O-acetyltransferase [Ceratocystis fimbriata CBS 114723]|uniref:Serine O-acetyltransferase n=1 Tax=Ceratocystis fimbriata CBS 114723 TaxID=1035309 RepID=A0A2C5X463_9PEZI|nr:Serine O-acetyltransferase [Ceratocystis fimbriata CBS 114723]
MSLQRQPVPLGALASRLTQLDLRKSAFPGFIKRSKARCVSTTTISKYPALAPSITAVYHPAVRPLSHIQLGLSRSACTATTSRSSPEVSPPVTRQSPTISRSAHVPASTPASNPAMAFPCLDKLESRSATLEAKTADNSGPEPSYTVGATQTFHSSNALLLDWGGVLPKFDIAYETWGTLNDDRSNAILLHTGLSASSHAHSTPENEQPGWWEKFIGPGCALDTEKYFVICTNVIGGCFGSTGPSSIDPADGARYATRFPILTLQDMVRAQFRLLDHLDIATLYASVGSSMGGMQSLAAGVLFPDRVGRVVSISGCARSHPYSIAMRHTQRQVLMMDPNWNRGFYYGRVPPHAGMKLAREIATVTYRSGPEWEQRFGRRRADPQKPPALCPDFLIETYLDHAGEKFCLTYDPNSLLYVSKAMDLFDLGAEYRKVSETRRAERQRLLEAGEALPIDGASCGLTLPDSPYTEQPSPASPVVSSASSSSRNGGPPEDLVKGLVMMKNTPTLVMGAASDILFPAWQQKEIADALELAGNTQVAHFELTQEMSMFGHDTFLLDLKNIGENLRKFLG